MLTLVIHELVLYMIEKREKVLHLNKTFSSYTSIFHSKRWPGTRACSTSHHTCAYFKIWKWITMCFWFSSVLSILFELEQAVCFVCVYAICMFAKWQWNVLCTWNQNHINCLPPVQLLIVVWAVSLRFLTEIYAQITIDKRL